MFSYKGFIAEVDYDDNAEIFYGSVINMNTILSFRGSTVPELKTSLADVVDTYLEECAHEGIEPEKPFSGKITVRVSPGLHRRIAIKAAARRESMNQYLEEIITRDTSDLETITG